MRIQEEGRSRGEGNEGKNRRRGRIEGGEEE
jgi:hypothetical protein